MTTWWPLGVGVGLVMVPKTTAVVACVVGALWVTRRRKVEGELETTVQDRALVGIERLMGKWMPSSSGQLTVVTFFEAGRMPRADVVREGYLKLAKGYPRLRAVPVMGSSLRNHGLAVSSDESMFDIGVEEVEDVRKRAFELIDERFPGRGLWRVDLISPKEKTERGAAVFRIDHALGDGLRLLNAASDILRTAEGSKPQVSALKRLFGNKDAASKRQPFTVIKLARDFFTALTLDKLPVETAPVAHPQGGLLAADQRIHAAGKVATLDQVKRIRLAHASCGPSNGAGVTVNDVLMTALSAALDTWAPGQGTTRALLAVALPLDTRGPAEGGLFNHFVMPSFEFPRRDNSNTTPTPLANAQRLKAVASQMADLKTSAVGVIIAKLASFVERLHVLDFVIADSQQNLFKKHSFVVSNVPGFDQPVYFDNAKVVDFHVFFPNMITQLLFTSYAGHFSVSVSSCCPGLDLDALIALVKTHLDPASWGL